MKRAKGAASRIVAKTRRPDKAPASLDWAPASWFNGAPGERTAARHAGEEGRGYIGDPLGHELAVAVDVFITLVGQRFGDG